MNVNNIPYRRESFAQKELLFDFDSDFNRYDASLLQDQHISKNIKELSRSIDSVKIIIAERGQMQVNEMLQTVYFRNNYGSPVSFEVGDSVDIALYSPDSVFLKLTNDEMLRVADAAVSRAQATLEQVQYNKILLGEPLLYLNRHSSEWHRKFALSFACLIFFFIGAPLGAIIRKGGFGFPVVVSVLMFVIYYIIDLTGYKMAREGIWEAYQGMWLSTAILLPVGVFLTYKAAVDASLFNRELYIKFFHSVKVRIYKFIKISVDEQEEEIN
jgi:lipopolysaccharide export system permease protein